jgi:hypothetical protein
MTSATEYSARLNTILQSTMQSGNLVLKPHWNSNADARQLLARIRQMQKEVRLLKKDVASTMKYVRSSFLAGKANVQAGFIATLAGKKASGHDRAQKRESLRRQQLAAIAPYEHVNRLIDDALTKLDGAKLQIEDWIVQHPDAIPPASVKQQKSKPPQAMPVSIQCSKCGAANPVEYRFCGDCGAPLFKPL